MIEIIFYYGGEIILVRVHGKEVYFSNSAYGNKFSTIDGLHLDKDGTIKQFPDLKEDPNWRKTAISRFKEYIDEMDNEEDIADYIIGELRSKGYLPKYKQKKGFRPITIK